MGKNSTAVGPGRFEVVETEWKVRVIRGQYYNKEEPGWLELFSHEIFNTSNFLRVPRNSYIIVLSADNSNSWITWTLCSKSSQPSLSVIKMSSAPGKVRGIDDFEFKKFDFTKFNCNN